MNRFTAKFGAVAGAVVLIVAFSAYPASAGGDDFANTARVYDADGLAASFEIGHWSIAKDGVMKSTIYAWEDPDVRWRNYRNAQVKWNVRPYCHKTGASLGREALVEEDVPLDFMVTRGPASGTSGDTEGDRHVSVGANNPGPFRECLVVRLHFKPYVLSGGEWHAGDTLVDYIRVAD